MTYKIFLDDERFPPEGQDFVIVRTSEQCIGWMKEYDCPEYISFDHDLGGDDTAMKVVHWIIEQDIRERLAGFTFIPENFTFYVHSQNPIGAKNITELLNSYLQFRRKEF